jgi:hypothetical protein
MTTPTPTRADKFIHDLKTLKIPDPANQRATLWLRTGAALMLIALILAAAAYFNDINADTPLAQGDAIVIGLTAIPTATIGATLFLRYSITNFLRYWLARQSLDLNTLADRLDNT